MSVTVQDAPDYTGLANVTIVGQIEALEVTGSITVSSGNVEITGPLTASGNIPVAIQESIQLDVNITNSVVNITGDVTVSSGSVDISGPLSASGNVNVAIQESVQIDVSVTNSTLNISGDVTVSSGSVDISGPLTTDGYVAVEITKSITINVNVTNSTLNITGDVTVSSGSVDISGPLTSEGNVSVAIQQSIQLDVNVTNSVINIQGSVDANITNATLTIEGDVNVTNSVLNVSITNEVLQSKLAKPALAFNGENAYVDCGNLPALGQEFSVFVIARRKGSTGTYGNLFGIDTPSWSVTGGLAVFDYNDGRIRARIRNHAEDAETSVGLETDVPNNVIRKYLVTWKRPDFKAYRDGVLVDSKTWDHDIGWNVYKCEIGRWGSHYWYGDVIEVLIYDHELTEDERNQLFNNPQSPPTNGLIAWWNFDEGSGDIAYDKSGNGNHGTIYNCVWVSEQGQVAPLLNVNISASQVTMDVNVTNASLDVNATIVDSTITLDVNVTNSTLNIQGDVNVTNTELNIRITAQDVNVEVINPTNWRVAFGSPTLLPETFSDTVSGGTTEYSVWSKSVTEGVRHVMRIALILYNPDTYWSPYDVVIHVIADGSDVINYRISDSHYYLGAGFLEAWLSGKSPDLYVLDPQDLAPVKVLWIKTGTTAPTFDGSPWTATTAPDIYAIGILIDIPFDFTDSAEIRISNTPTGNPDIYVRGAVFYGIYK